MFPSTKVLDSKLESTLELIRKGAVRPEEHLDFFEREELRIDLPGSTSDRRVEDFHRVPDRYPTRVGVAILMPL